jgi:hypothetical protein
MMPYDLIRATLGLAQIALFLSIIRKDIGYIIWFGFLMFAQGTYNLLPAYPYDNLWKYWVQIPAFLGLIALSVPASVEIFAVMPRRTFEQERHALAAWAAAVGGCAVVVGWKWRSENFYQAFMLIRQYCFIALAAGYGAAWAWIRFLRPLPLDDRTRIHARLWGIWLVLAAVLASTTKGGLFWSLFPWEMGAWQAASYGLLGQLCLCAAFYLNVHEWARGRGVFRVIPPYLPALEPSRSGSQLPH